MADTPPLDAELVKRPSGRVIVTDPDFFVLMLRGVDPSRPARGGFWWTPGGGLAGSETPREGAQRELWEETGIEVDDLGPVVLVRTGVFAMEDNWYDSHETFFFVQLNERRAPQPQAFDDVELRSVTDVRWRSVDAIRESDDPVYPKCLVDLLWFIRTHGRPSAPWTERS